MTPEARLALADKFEKSSHNYRPEIFGEADRTAGPGLTRTECMEIAAVLRDLPVRAQEVVAFQKRPKFGEHRIWSSMYHDDAEFWRGQDYEIRPLYAAPPPSGEHLTSSSRVWSDENLPQVSALSAPSEASKVREALQAVADFMRKDVQSGDCDLWTPEYEELHDQVIVALAAQPPVADGVREALEFLAQHFVVKDSPNASKNQYGHLELWWAANSVRENPDALRNPWMLLGSAESSFNLAAMGELKGALLALAPPSSGGETER